MEPRPESATRPSQPRVLFVALGETEVPAFEHIASMLNESATANARVVTWLPRLATERTTSLERQSPSIVHDLHTIATRLASAGISAVSMAADYDRDWHFASNREKTRHVERVYNAVTDTVDAFAPDVIFSSVGGETTRVVTNAVAQDRGIPTAYFNSIPLPKRFVILRSLAAPFIGYSAGVQNYLPTNGAPTQDFEAGSYVLGQPPQKSAAADGIARAWSQFVMRQKTYPASWLRRKSTTLLRDWLLNRIPTQSQGFDPDHSVKVLYPLHDERDFQVAVRERHAVPQSSLLRYLSSELPPGFHLYVKPHPEHLAAHHTRLWKDLLKRPNVHFLPPGMPAAEAIDAADVVLTLASSLGFEAAAVAKPVVCYGRPFYGGRGITVDVSDPRTLSEAIRGAVGTVPDSASFSTLTETMLKASWDGQFTPLSLEAANLDKLSVGVRDVLRTL